MDFVRSGFRAVAAFLEPRTGVSRRTLQRTMLRLLERNGRGRVFDDVLASLAVDPPVSVPTLIFLYRTHRPRIRLYPDVAAALARLRRTGLKMGLITDSYTAVQRNKIYALRLEKELDLVVCTDELGREFWKPSKMPFKVAMEILRVPRGKALYVGDDPAKDIPGARAAGMIPVLIRRQPSPSPPFVRRPDHVVGDMQELLSLVRRLSCGKAIRTTQSTGR